MKKVIIYALGLLAGILIFIGSIDIPSYKYNIAYHKAIDRSSETKLESSSADVYLNSFFEINIQILTFVHPVKLLERLSGNNSRGFQSLLGSSLRTNCLRYNLLPPHVNNFSSKYFNVVRRSPDYYLYTLQQLII